MVAEIAKRKQRALSAPAVIVRSDDHVNRLDSSSATVIARFYKWSADGFGVEHDILLSTKLS